MRLDWRLGVSAAAMAAMISCMAPAQAQYRIDPNTNIEALNAADAQFQAGDFRAATEGYRALLDRAGDGPDALILAVRLGIAANRSGQYAVAYSALSRQIASPHWARQDPGLMDRALEEGVDAAASSGRGKEAFAFAEQLLDHRIKTQGADAPVTQAARLTMATFLDEAGDHAAAGTLRDQAFDTYSKGDRNTYLAMMNQSAVQLQNRGDLDGAAKIFERLVGEMAKDPDSIEQGIVAFNVAILDRDRRAFDSAIRHHERAIEILERVAGKDSSEAIAALGGLGDTYNHAGRPAAAIPFMREAYKRAEKTLGATDDTMLQANNLANALREVRQYAEAEALDRKALDWRVTNLGPTREPTMISRQNLIMDLIQLDRIADAKAEQDKLVAALEETRGPDDALAQSARRNAARLAVAAGDASLETLDLGELAENAEASSSNVMLASLLSQVAARKGDHANALKLARTASSLSDAYYGELHQMSLNELRLLAFAERDSGSASTTATYIELERRARLWSQREYASTDDAAILEQVGQRSRDIMGDLIAYSFQAARKDPEANKLFATVLSDWKAVGSLERAVMQNAEATLPETDKALVEKVRTLKAQTLGKPRGVTMDELRRQLTVAEAALADRVSALRQVVSDNEPYAATLARLGPDEAVIDYLIAPMNMKEGTVERVFAMLGRAGGQTFLYDLGKLDEVAAPLVGGSANNPDARRKLYTALIQRFEPQLEGVQRLHIVPDGILNLAPFDGLIDANGRNLIEKRDVRIARNARAVSGGLERAVEGGGVLLVGDVDYGKGSSFAPLPYTKVEVDRIAGQTSAAKFTPKLIEGMAASEAAVREAAPGNRILHFATHGFFQPVSATETAPLWRAGVAVSGANSAAAANNPTDDGILHAAELTGWPLSGVELAVFSACDTAQGDRSYVEGLSGLPSALAAAGVKRSLLARWPVNDEGAANFMIRFYENLAAKRGYAAALRQTKLDAIAGKIDKVDENTWLAFALIENERSEQASAEQAAADDVVTPAAGAASTSNSDACVTDARSAEPLCADEPKN